MPAPPSSNVSAATAELILDLQRRVGNAAVVAGLNAQALPGGLGRSFNLQRKVKKKGDGYKAYSGPRLSVKLREMMEAGTLAYRGKPLQLSESDVFLLQSVANVESAGKVAGVNTWDNQIVSMGFKQVVLIHGSLYDVIKMVPSAFERHGISLGGDAYAIRFKGKVKKRPKIVGAEDPDELRGPEWAQRFLDAGLDDEIISALVVYALDDERELHGKVAKKTKGKTHPLMDDPTVRAWLFQAYNNRPAFAVRAATSVLNQTAGKQMERDRFLDIVEEAIRVEYRKRSDKQSRGGNEEWKANNIVTKIPRSGVLGTKDRGSGRKAPPVPTTVAGNDGPASRPTSTPEKGGDLASLALGFIGAPLQAVNSVAQMLGAGDARSLLERKGIDANSLTNVLFFLRHPEMGGRPIRRDERALAREWLNIRDNLARPFISRLGSTARGTSRTPPAPAVTASGPSPSPNTPTPREVEPLTPDAAMAAQWHEDWEDPAFSTERERFDEGGRPKGTPKQRYDILTKHYASRGIARPLKFIQDNIVPTTFFGKRTPAHKDLSGKLAEAEAHFRRTSAAVPLERAWAFTARTTSGGSWSNHADGRAIDVDAPWNPHLTDARDRRVITGLSDLNIEEENPGGPSMDSYDASKLASDRFQAAYNEKGLQDAIARWTKREPALVAERDRIQQQRDAIPGGKRASRADHRRRKELGQEIIRLNRLLGYVHKKKRVPGVAETLRAELERFRKNQPKLTAAAAKVAGLMVQIQAATATLGEGTTKQRRAAAQRLRGLKKQLNQAKKAHSKAESALDRYSREGFLNLSKPLVQSMKAVGLRWGGDWKTHKDYMHFDLP